MKTIGVIGTGAITTQVHLPILLAMDDVRVAWITDDNPKIARSVAAAHGVSAVSLENGISGLPSADVVLLAIPLSPRPPYLNHFKGTATALLVEKPLANSADEHRRIVADFPNWQVAVGFQRRYYGSFATVREFIQSGTLGRLRGIRVAEGGRVTRTDGGGQYQSLSAEHGGGVVKNLGCHALDLALWLSSAKAFSIRANEVAWDGATDQRCHAFVELQMQTGPPVELDFSMSWIDRMENRIEFRFESGILSCPIAPATQIDLLSVTGRPLARLDLVIPGRATTSRQAFYLEWCAMLDAVSARAVQPNSAAETLLCSELIDALLERKESAV